MANKFKEGDRVVIIGWTDDPNDRYTQKIKALPYKIHGRIDGDYGGGNSIYLKVDEKDKVNVVDFIDKINLLPQAGWLEEGLELYKEGIVISYV